MAETEPGTGKPYHHGNLRQALVEATLGLIEERGPLGFTLADGTALTVENGWRGRPQQRAFLRAVRDGACERFDAVLSPDYNRAHSDHLHFDLGPDKLCR